MIGSQGMNEYIPKPIDFIRNLLKDRPESEITEAEDRMRRYLSLIVEIVQSQEEEDMEIEKNELVYEYL